MTMARRPPSGLSARIMSPPCAIGDVAGDGEAEAGAAAVDIAGGVEPVERPEHRLALLRRDARAVVVDGHRRASRRRGAPAISTRSA